ncbi:hypothetical protein DV515_00015299 [Chloebia gouldiae]|uniref:Uncharacterized protein n=1 Tax=Chloebia gouldiae TaxID=44316 RepID=A0A3L8RVK3_CHLGU|nr:hypothetical protein DV515_00015299 [Chloebia gouldiae]
MGYRTLPSASHPPSQRSSCENFQADPVVAARLPRLLEVQVAADEVDLAWGRSGDTAGADAGQEEAAAARLPRVDDGVVHSPVQDPASVAPVQTLRPGCGARGSSAPALPSSPSPDRRGSISKGGGSSSQRKHKTSSDCPQHLPGLTMAHTPQQTTPSGEKGIQVPSSPTCSPLLPASFQGGTPILMPAGCTGSLLPARNGQSFGSL